MLISVSLVLVIAFLNGLNSTVFRPFFIFIQRWNFLQCSFCISTVHRLTVMAKRLLRESFRVASSFGSFRSLTF